MPKKKKGSRSAYHAPNKFPFGLFTKSEFKTGAPKVKVKGAVERPADLKIKGKGKAKKVKASQGGAQEGGYWLCFLFLGVFFLNCVDF